METKTYPLMGLPKAAFQMASGLMLVIPVLMTMVAIFIIFMPGALPTEKLRVLALIVPLVVVSLISHRLFSKALAESRLELSPEGITQIQFGIKQFAKWEDVERIDKVAQGRFIVEGLKLKDARFSGQPWAVWLSTLGRNHLEIPLASYAKNWRESELADDLQTYAPWLFVE
jgi:hypothetical protein